jgi:hypothetical protein
MADHNSPSPTTSVPSVRAVANSSVSTMEILRDLGRRPMVGGQEDMIVDVALDLLAARVD